MTLMFIFSFPKGIELTKVELTRVTAKQPPSIYVFGIVLLGWFKFNLIPIIMLIIILIKARNERTKEK